MQQKRKKIIKYTFRADGSLSHAKTFVTYKSFKDLQQLTENNPRSGSLSTSINNDVLAKKCEKVRNGRRLTVCDLAVEAETRLGLVIELYYILYNH